MDGWRDLICDLVDLLEKEGPKLKLAQVKEKFGGLRFYLMYGSDEIVKAAVGSAEDKSFSICEGCGLPAGQMASAGWTKTICPDCFKSWDKSRRASPWFFEFKPSQD